MVAGRDGQEHERWDFQGMTHLSDMVRHPEKRDLDFKETPSKKFADPSTALGFAERRGSGNVRHVNNGICWIQEKNDIWELQQHTKQKSAREQCSSRLDDECQPPNFGQDGSTIPATFQGRTS